MPFFDGSEVSPGRSTGKGVCGHRSENTGNGVCGPRCENTGNGVCACRVDCRFENTGNGVWGSSHGRRSSRLWRGVVSMWNLLMNPVLSSDLGTGTVAWLSAPEHWKRGVCRLQRGVLYLRGLFGIWSGNVGGELV